MTIETTPTKLMEKVAEVAPKEYAFFKSAAAEIGKGPFHKEVKEEMSGIMKQAEGALANFMNRYGRTAGEYLGGVGLAAGTAALGGIAMSLAGDIYGAAKRGLTKSRYYSSMLEQNPDLREAPAERVQRAFSTLHRLNPEFSGDPTVAGAYVRSQAQLDLPQWNPNEMKTLIDSHKSLQDSAKLPSVPNFNPYQIETNRLQAEKLRQDTDADFQYERNRPQHEMFDAQRKKADYERLMQVERRINERAAAAAKARAHRPFNPNNP